MQRATFKKRQEKYSDMGLLIRCVRVDERPVDNILHYLEDGKATLEVTIAGGMYLMPVILLLRALKETTDPEIYNTVMLTTGKKLFLSERLELMLRQYKLSGVACYHVIFLLLLFLLSYFT